jgi:hypothetical protein
MEVSPVKKVKRMGDQMRNNFYQHAENVLKSMWAPLLFQLPARALLSPETGKSPFCWHCHFTKKIAPFFFTKTCSQ